MIFTIEENDATPVYRQVIDQVREQIARGKLSPGEKLPSVRELARYLDINVNTVQKAYRELKHLGLVLIRPARGAIVSPEAPKILGSVESEEVLRVALKKVLAEARRLGFNREHVLRLLEKME